MKTFEMNEKWKRQGDVFTNLLIPELLEKSNRKAMHRNWSNQIKANPALKTKAGNR